MRCASKPPRRDTNRVHESLGVQIGVRRDGQTAQGETQPTQNVLIAPFQAVIDLAERLFGRWKHVPRAPFTVTAARPPASSSGPVPPVCDVGTAPSSSSAILIKKALDYRTGDDGRVAALRELAALHYRPDRSPYPIQTRCDGPVFDTVVLLAESLGVSGLPILTSTFTTLNPRKICFAREVRKDSFQLAEPSAKLH